MHARRNRRQEFSVGRGSQAFLGAGDADELLGLVVIGRHFVVVDRPIRAQAVERVRFEVVIGEAQRNPAVVIGAAAHDSRAPPHELGTLGDSVRLAFEMPVAGRRGEISERPRRFAEVLFGVRPGAAMVHLVRPDMLFEILHGIQHRPGLEQRHVDSQIGEHFGDGAAAGAGANYNHVVHLGTALDLQHDSDYITARGGQRRCRNIEFRNEPNFALSGQLP